MIQNKYLNKQYGRLKVIEILDKIFCKCLCQCGVEKRIRYANLANGTINSCGCLLHDFAKENIKIAQKAKTKYDPIEISAKRYFEKRYADGNLSLHEFIFLSQLNCYYCGAKPNNKFNVHKHDKRSSPERIAAGNFIYNGLDRMDNNKSHVYENLVTCCHRCNLAKLDYSLTEFITHIFKMFSFREKNYRNNYENIQLPNLDKLFKIEPKINLKEIKLPEKIESGLIIGKLTILKRVENDKNNHIIFLCKCDCGKEKNVLKSSLLRGKNKTCGKNGCRSKYDSNIMNGRMLWINAGYKKEGLLFEDFYQISQLNCTYCGELPSNSISLKKDSQESPFIYNGIDRIDSTKTHTINNIVPSCWNCNRFKGSSSLKELNEWLTNLYKTANMIMSDSNFYF